MALLKSKQTPRTQFYYLITFSFYPYMVLIAFVEVSHAGIRQG